MGERISDHLSGRQGWREGMVYGARPYAFYEVAVLKLAPNVVKQEYSKDWQFYLPNILHLPLKSLLSCQACGAPNVRHFSTIWLPMDT